MGLSSTTQHIRNPEALTKAQFKKAFCEYMKTKGYTTATEDTAELSYALVFTKDRKWVTVLSEDETDPNSTAAEYAKSLGTYAVMVELVDSDFAELSLFDSTGAHIDTLTLGESYLEDAAPMGEPSAWQPLMVGSWEQVEAIQNGSYTFAEEAVAEFAPVIGMDGENVLLDNDSDVDEKKAVTLFFKSAKEKKLTLDTAFVNVFKTGLGDIGFSHIKINRHSLFVRIINDDILQIITYRKVSATKRNCKSYELYGGMATLYRRTIDLEETPETWLRDVREYYDHIIPEKERDDRLARSMLTFNCDISNNESMIRDITYSYELADRYMLPVLNNITDLNDCIKYFYDFSYDMHEMKLAELDKFMNEGIYCKSEGLLLILTDFKDDCSKWLQREIKRETKFVSDPERADLIRLKCERKYSEQLEIRNRIQNSLDLKKAAIDLAKQYKTNNLKMLEGYNL